MLEFDQLMNIINTGGTPIIGVVAYFIWKIERKQALFIKEIKSKQEERDGKIDAIKSDIDVFIRKLAHLNGDKK